MKKFLFALIALACTPVLQAQVSSGRVGGMGRHALEIDNPDLRIRGATNLHPFRKVGSRYWDLRPLTTTAPENLPKELAQWKKIESYKILEVGKDGLLLQPYRGNTTILLKNYPRKKPFVDGESMPHCVVFEETEPYTYISVLGSKNTIRSYDYGIPYDPWELARQRSSTNAVKKK